jgi:hypothetical protein
MERLEPLQEDESNMKKVLVSLCALALVLYFVPATHAADKWVLLGQAHVDGQHDHDNIKVGDDAGRFRFLQIRVVNGPIEFDHIVVHYGNGEPETLQVRDVIKAGGHSRAIPLQGDRIVQSFELWYSKANPSSSKPEINLWGQR